MAWVIDQPNVIPQGIAATDTVQNHVLGKIVKAKDSTLGEGEFIYLKGVASTIVGSCVTYDSTTFATTLAAIGTNLPQPVAFAMSACVANNFGWYQISGLTTAAKSVNTSLAAAAAIGVKTIGFVAASGSGKEIQGALVAAVASAKSDVSTVKIMTNRPRMQGRTS